MLTAFYDPGYTAPIGDHMMPMRKFALVVEGLRDASDVRLVSPERIGVEELRRVHAEEYIRAVETGEPRALAESQKFPWSPALYPSVLLTNRGVIAAARQGLRDGGSGGLTAPNSHGLRRMRSVGHQAHRRPSVQSPWRVP